MFCKNCGNQIADAAVVCPKCGVPVAGKSVAQASGKVPNHMVGAILSTLFCCQIGGIIANVYAAQLNSKLANGDVEGARAASKTANTWITVSVVFGVIVCLLYFIAGVAGSI